MWMDGTLFQEWLHELDRKFEMQGKKVVMMVDNCSAHPEVSGLKAIDLQFLPPKTTYFTQPMNQGVISMFTSYFINKNNRIALECLDFAAGLHC